MGAAIAQWISLRLPSCCPGFESQAHHLCFFQFILFKLYICHLNWNVKTTKINIKQAGIGPFLKIKEKSQGQSKYYITRRDGIYRARIIYRNILVSSQPWLSPHFIFKSTHLNTLQMPVDLVFILKWVKSAIRCALNVFHLTDITAIIALKHLPKVFFFLHPLKDDSGGSRGRVFDCVRVK